MPTSRTEVQMWRDVGDLRDLGYVQSPHSVAESGSHDTWPKGNETKPSYWLDSTRCAMSRPSSSALPMSFSSSLTAAASQALPWTIPTTSM